MSSKIENVTLIDSNAIANEIMHDLADVEQMESMFEMELSSEELFRLDCAILSSLRDTQDFSKDLLFQLESKFFEERMERPPKEFDDALEKLQTDTMSEMAFPIQELFNSMEDYIVEALAV